MSDDIPFDKKFDLPPGQVDEVMPGVRRIVAPNPGPFTFTGTVTYIVGRGKVAIIDPGPEHEGHIASVLDAVRAETVTHIFVTHTHRDHSPAVPHVRAATGATVLAEGRHRPARPLHIGETNGSTPAATRIFSPTARWSTGRLSKARAGRWKR
jgi:glyoxylase-like metal-dependent hydrolase (beta-lactamase superfamily II)